MRKRRGFTLTELAIVLGIMGTILGAIWTASAHVSARNKAQKASGQVQLILAGYRSIFGARRVDTMGDITCMGVNAGIFPSDMLPPNPCGANLSPSLTYPKTPWGGGSYVYVWADQANNAVRIGYYGIPQSACIALANAQANAPGVIYSYAGLGNTSPHYATYPPLAAEGGPVPWTLAQINIYCADSATQEEVTFAYTMN